MFKDRGGRFFKANQYALECYEVNEEVALASELTFEKNMMELL